MDLAQALAGILFQGPCKLTGTMFSQTFFYSLVILGLVWTALGILALIILFVRDWKNGDLW